RGSAAPFTELFCGTFDRSIRGGPQPTKPLHHPIGRVGQNLWLEPTGMQVSSLYQSDQILAARPERVQSQTAYRLVFGELCDHRIDVNMDLIAIKWSG
ncbi:MAG TPA: hypothetical protein VGR71_17010, partial [Nitrospira sp.]|nr:hypothetical protein [Nitrospira sp.]